MLGTWLLWRGIQVCFFTWSESNTWTRWESAEQQHWREWCIDTSTSNQLTQCLFWRVYDSLYLQSHGNEGINERKHQQALFDATWFSTTTCQKPIHKHNWTMEFDEKAYRRCQSMSLFLYPISTTLVQFLQESTIRHTMLSMYTFPTLFLFHLLYKCCFHSIKSDPTCLSCILGVCFRYGSCQSSLTQRPICHGYFTIQSHPPTPYLFNANHVIWKSLDRLTRLFWICWLTDIVVKTKQFASEFLFSLHNHPDLGSDALVDKLYRSQCKRWSRCSVQWPRILPNGNNWDMW